MKKMLHNRIGVVLPPVFHHLFGKTGKRPLSALLSVQVCLTNDSVIAYLYNYRLPLKRRLMVFTSDENISLLHDPFSSIESPRRYVESDVNIHYRCPVRHDPLPLVPERELARQQAEHMKRLYREQKRNKYLQVCDVRPLPMPGARG